MFRVFGNELLQLVKQFLVQLAEAAQLLLLPKVLNHHEDFLALRILLNWLLLFSRKHLLLVFASSRPSVLGAPDGPGLILCVGSVPLLGLLLLELHLYYSWLSQRYHVLVDDVVLIFVLYHVILGHVILGEVGWSFNIGVRPVDSTVSHGVVVSCTVLLTILHNLVRKSVLYGDNFLGLFIVEGLSHLIDHLTVVVWGLVLVETLGVLRVIRGVIIGLLNVNLLFFALSAGGRECLSVVHLRHILDNLWTL